MAINRFSQGPIEADVRSTYIPLPIDVINQQGELRQSQYDTTKAFIDATQEAYYGAKAMSPDVGTLKEITSKYDEDIKKAISDVGGDIGRLKNFASELGAKVKKDMMSGYMGAIHNNYVKAQNHMKEVLDNKDYSQEGKNRALASISAFTGTTEDGKGGYTTPQLYTPVKYIEGGKLADEYGKVLADQYDAKGQKFKDAKSASSLIERNLWNNQEMLANAREQVWATYGDLPPDKEHIAVSAYLKNIADAAGFKVAYHQIFKPEPVATSGSSSVTTGGIPIAVNFQGAKPLRNMFNMAGTNFFDELSNAENITAAGKIKSGAMSIPTSGLVGPGYGITANATLPRETEIREQEAARIKLEANKKAKESLNKLSKSDMVQDIAKSFGIDLNNPSLETVQKIKDAMENINNSSASTRVIFHQDEKGVNQFEYLLNSGNILNMNITDVNTGKDLTIKEKRELYTKYLGSDKKGGEGSAFYGGSIMDPGQPYPVGTMAISVNDKNEPRQLLIDLGQNTNTQEFFNDRALAAYNSGASWYKDGKSTVQFLRDNKTGIVNVYRDGKRALQEDGTPLRINFTKTR